MGSFFVRASAERAILRAFRDQEVTCELYLASECSSQHRCRDCMKDRWWDGVLVVRFGGLGLWLGQVVWWVGGFGDGVQLVSEGRMGVVRGEMRCG